MKRKRRGRGEASIFHRASDGLWVGTISLGVDARGKPIRKTIYRLTKGEVSEALRKLQAEHDAGRLMLAEDLTVGEFLKRWLPIVKDKIGAATFVRYRQLTEIYLIPALGSIKLSKLRPIHVESAYASFARKTDKGTIKASAWTRKSAGSVLGIALRHAVRMNLIPHNPAAEVTKPRPEFREMAFLTPPQVRVFLAAAKSSNNYPLYALALGSGCRLGELLAFVWSDFNFEKGTVEVKRSISQVGKETIIKEPKSRSGRRTITLPDFAIEAMKNHRREMQAAGLLKAPVFCTRHGTHHDKKNMRRAFEGVIRKANAAAAEAAEQHGAEADLIPESLRFHDLRHTHASCLISAGHSVKAVSRRLGHADITITLKTYAHLMPDDDAKLASATSTLFG